MSNRVGLTNYTSPPYRQPRITSSASKLEPPQTCGPSPMQNLHTESPYHYVNSTSCQHTHAVAAASPHTRTRTQTESSRSAGLAMVITPLPSHSHTDLTESDIELLAATDAHTESERNATATADPPGNMDAATDLPPPYPPTHTLNYQNMTSIPLPHCRR